jgi:NADPH-dependent 2,4-dienoyl-CoA reductase/sulfur reductase-like enzyme
LASLRTPSEEASAVEAISHTIRLSLPFISFSPSAASFSYTIHPTELIMTPPRVIVVGGGLSGLSAAHTVYLNGGNVLVLDKNSKPQFHSSLLEPLS